MKSSIIGQEKPYLIKQVDELLFSDSNLELTRLSHPKKDRFNLL